METVMETVTDAFADGVTIARRNLTRIIRVPQILVGMLITPLLMVLLFAYVFGGSIDIAGGSYREFLVAGAFALNLMFGATYAGIGMADDMQQGISDRFRSLPMSRAAVIVGRTTSNVIGNVLTLAIMALAGLVVGWRVHTGIAEVAMGFGLLLLFAYAIAWIMVYVALLVPSVEAVQSASGMVVFPLTFIANTFVPVDNLPTPLRILAEWNPVSTVTQAARELFGNIPPGTPEPTAWALQNAALYTLLWVAIIIAVVAPLAIGRYMKAAAS
jgi:ABC transporter DrrB family efflux protein